MADRMPNLDRAASAANRASTPPARDRRGRDGVNALAHAIESYVARRANPITDRLAESAFGLIAEHLPAAVAGDTRPEVLNCLPRRMQQAMGAVPHADISHGCGLAVLYSAWLRRSYPHAGPRFDRGGRAARRRFPGGRRGRGSRSAGTHRLGFAPA
jgi:alcohol dehydrogenase YqhD (iron-dependent ADH family)